MLSNPDLENALKRTIQLYNLTRSPGVLAKLVLCSSFIVTVSFTGGFCYGCGVSEYIDGFISQFKLLSGKFELKFEKSRQVNARTFETDFSVREKT
jgi:hypothetical protein